MFFNNKTHNIYALCRMVLLYCNEPARDRASAPLEDNPFLAVAAEMIPHNE